MADDPTEAVFAGKRALVIGGTGGIGRAVALALAKKGAAVTITGGNSPERLESALTELNATNLRNKSPQIYAEKRGFLEQRPEQSVKIRDNQAGNLRRSAARLNIPRTSIKKLFHSGFLCRIGGPDGLSPEKAAALILEKTECDILVAAWGPFIRQPLHQTKPQDWRFIVENNLIFPGILVSSVLPGMIARKWGRILLFGGTNTAGIRGYSTTAAYGAAKTALGVLAKSAAQSAGKYGVTCNVICPGLTETEYTGPEDRLYYRKKSPGGESLTPEEIAACALDVLENSALNGTVIPIDKGIWV